MKALQKLPYKNQIQTHTSKITSEINQAYDPTLIYQQQTRRCKRANSMKSKHNPSFKMNLNFKLAELRTQKLNYQNEQNR